MPAMPALRRTLEQHGGTVAPVASPKERDDVESHQKQRFPEASVRRARSVGVTNVVTLGVTNVVTT